MESMTLTASDGHPVACYVWRCTNPSVTGIVQIAHGMGEHARRYDWVAQQLNAAGYHVVANDHRGHGATVATADGAKLWGWMGGDGWNRTLSDLYEINCWARNEFQQEIVLLGHSMGAMLAQQYITRFGDSIKGLALSGSPGFKSTFAMWLTRLFAHVEAVRHGEDANSDLLQNMLFGGANKPFDDTPGATGFEWLSRDPEQVQLYLNDEACGAVLTTGSLLDMSYGTGKGQNPHCLGKVPQGLPIYVFSGTDDPIHSERKDIHRMLQKFYDAGLHNITVQWYDGGRHEVFNETNRDAVVRDLVVFLDGIS